MTQSEQDLIINKLKGALSASYNPTALYLYGSRALGTAHPDSDYDFVMVVNGFKTENRLQEMMTIAQNCQRHFGVQVQVWIYNQSEFRERLADFGSIPETAVSTGREIQL